MAIVMEHREKATVMKGAGSRGVPLIRCDHCGEHIEHADDGNARWQSRSDGGLHVSFLHGSCVADHDRYHDEAYRSMPLGRFVRRLGISLSPSGQA